MTPPRQRIRDQQLTVGLGCVIRDEEVLLIRRREPDNKDLDGRLELPGGKVDFGERPLDAIEREVREETGAIVRASAVLPHVYAKVQRYNDRHVHAIVLCASCDFVGQEDLQVLPDKISEVIWYPLADLDPLDVQSGSSEFLNHVVKSFGRREAAVDDQHAISLRGPAGQRFAMTVHARLGETDAFGARIVNGSGSERRFNSRDELLLFVDQQMRKHASWSIERVDPQFPRVGAFKLLGAEPQVNAQEALFQ